VGSSTLAIKPSRTVPRSLSIPRWEPPEVADSDLSYAVTSSVLEQFALGHTIGDVLRELVQNEYDARGSTLTVTFGHDGLEIHGNGTVIDRAGWRRLSVMLGTGHVVGEERDVPQKINGIGSKNHGLRALFLIGDEIYVRSGGHQSVLDLYRGTLQRPRPDTASRGLPGAHIFVPYRSQSRGLLEEYDAAREGRDFQVLADELAPTLVKLAEPGGPRSLRTVAVSSERVDRSLVWTQKVKRLGRHRLGGPLLERTIELRDDGSAGAAVSQKIVELEYQRPVDIPERYRSRAFANYFHARGGRLSIGISLRLKRKRPDLEDRGAFYYPLGFAHGLTGSAISVNAPFEMNPDRSALVEPGSSSWNEWLLDAAASSAVHLLVGDWFGAFGADAYLSLAESHAESAGRFTERVAAELTHAECWPSRQRRPGSRQPRFRAAEQITLGRSPDLDALVGEAKQLDGRLDDPRVVAMAQDAGAHDFGVAAAVRLRCAGEDSSDLKTVLQDEQSLFYPEFPGALLDLECQERFAKAFDVHRRQLTKENKADLADTPTTLTAAGTLAAPSEPLWVVDESVAGVAPVPKARRLHPALARYKVIRELCEPFDVSGWALHVAREADEGTADEAQRDGLYRYLIAKPETITRQAWPALRRAPILRDHRGDWVAAESMVQRRIARASLLEPALHFPSREMARSPKLLQSLRIRKKLTGEDLIRYAGLVADDATLSGDFEDALVRLSHLLTRPTVTKLRSIAFLRSTRGGRVAPEDAYVRTPELLDCIGPDAEFAAGPHSALHRRLGCLTEPRAEDIVIFVDTLREAGKGVARPGRLYAALLGALRKEREPLRFAAHPILFDNGHWHPPQAVLLGAKHRRIFGLALPVVSAGTLEPVLAGLGAPTEPSAQQWRRLFEWADDRSDGGVRRLSQAERGALRLAYARLGALPADVPATQRVFLDTDGRLHSQAAARAGRYVINDEPQTAQVIEQSAPSIKFADLAGGAAVRRFLTTSGVQLLTDARHLVRVEIGDERPGPRWFDESEIVGQLQRAAFASAVHAVAAAGGSSTATLERELNRRLRQIKRITFVSSVGYVYRVGTTHISVVSDVATEDERVALQFVRGKSELYGLLAQAIATMAEARVSLQQPLADSIFRILTAASSAELKRYLAQRGIDWRPRGGVGADEEAAPDDEETESREQIAEALKAKLVETNRKTTGSGAGRNGQGSTTTSGQAAGERPTRELPPLDDVEMSEASANGWQPPERRRGGGGGGGGTWAPRSPQEQEEDRRLGQRGEALVYREEVKRVRALGYPASRVAWTSQSNPAADHDIRSVADDGADLWIEVKATTGRHGRFDWSRGEFELAVGAREHYVLCRVYEADTTRPSYVRIADPVAKLLAGEMRLDISNLAAEVAPLSE